MPTTITTTAGNGVVKTATPTMLVSADFQAPMSATAHPEAGVVTRGQTAQKLTGTLIYLADTLADARAITGVYAAATTSLVPVTLTDDDAQISGLRHVVSGDVTIRRAETLNGVPAPWLISVPVMEV